MKLEDKIKAFMAHDDYGSQTKVGMCVVPQIGYDGNMHFLITKMIPYIDYHGQGGRGGHLPQVQNGGQISLTVDEMKQVKEYLNGLEF